MQGKENPIIKDLQKSGFRRRSPLPSCLKGFFVETVVIIDRFWLLTDAMSSILDEFPRGGGSRQLNQHDLPFAAWTDGKAILASPALSYDPRNPGAKLLLGELDGQLIGLEDDRNMITIAS